MGHRTSLCSELAARAGLTVDRKNSIPQQVLGRAPPEANLLRCEDY